MSNVLRWLLVLGFVGCSTLTTAGCEPSSDIEHQEIKAAHGVFAE